MNSLTRYYFTCMWLVATGTAHAQKLDSNAVIRSNNSIVVKNLILTQPRTVFAAVFERGGNKRAERIVTNINWTLHVSPNGGFSKEDYGNRFEVAKELLRIKWRKSVSSELVSNNAYATGLLLKISDKSPDKSVRGGHSLLKAALNGKSEYNKGFALKVLCSMWTPEYYDLLRTYLLNEKSKDFCIAVHAYRMWLEGGVRANNDLEITNQLKRIAGSMKSGQACYEDVHKVLGFFK